MEEGCCSQQRRRQQQANSSLFLSPFLFCPISPLLCQIRPVYSGKMSNSYRGPSEGAASGRKGMLTAITGAGRGAPPPYRLLQLECTKGVASIRRTGGSPPVCSKLIPLSHETSRSGSSSSSSAGSTDSTRTVNLGRSKTESLSGGRGLKCVESEEAPPKRCFAPPLLTFNLKQRLEASEEISNTHRNLNAQWKQQQLQCGQQRKCGRRSSTNEEMLSLLVPPHRPRAFFNGVSQGAPSTHAGNCSVSKFSGSILGKQERRFVERGSVELNLWTPEGLCAASVPVAPLGHPSSESISSVFVSQRTLTLRNEVNVSAERPAGLCEEDEVNENESSGVPVLRQGCPAHNLQTLHETQNREPPQAAPVSSACCSNANSNTRNGNNSSRNGSGSGTCSSGSTSSSCCSAGISGRGLLLRQFDVLTPRTGDERGVDAPPLSLDLHKAPVGAPTDSLEEGVERLSARSPQLRQLKLAHAEPNASDLIETTCNRINSKSRRNSSNSSDTGSSSSGNLSVNPGTQGLIISGDLADGGRILSVKGHLVKASSMEAAYMKGPSKGTPRCGSVTRTGNWKRPPSGRRRGPSCKGPKASEMTAVKLFSVIGAPRRGPRASSAADVGDESPSSSKTRLGDADETSRKALRLPPQRLEILWEQSPAPTAREK